MATSDSVSIIDRSWVAADNVGVGGGIDGRACAHLCGACAHSHARHRDGCGGDGGMDVPSAKHDRATPSAYLGAGRVRAAPTPTALLLLPLPFSMEKENICCTYHAAGGGGIAWRAYNARIMHRSANGDDDGSVAHAKIIGTFTCVFRSRACTGHGIT